MKTIPVCLSLLCFFLIHLPVGYAAEQEKKDRLKELDAYWAEVSRTVREGDFEGYKATCHEQGVLVSGSKRTSYPLSEALARWKKDFTATKTGKIKAKVEFRFSQRFSDETTAHETGIFLYSFTDPEGQWKHEHVHFQALLLKSKAGWKIMMEYQKSKATQAEWDALAEQSKK